MEELKRGLGAGKAWKSPASKKKRGQNGRNEEISPGGKKKEEQLDGVSLGKNRRC